MRSMLFVVAGLASLYPVTAEAHIHLTAPVARTDSMTGDQKARDCGVAGQVRTNRVTTFKPGETITVTWLETVNHTGHYRVSFQPNGSVFPLPRAAAGGGFPNTNQEGLDAATGAIVLKDLIPDGMLSTTVTLPNMECDNCTLQFIQVMDDGDPYSVSSLYFNCADITLSNGAPSMVDAGPVQPGADAGVDPMNPGGPSDTSGGCATTGGTGLAAGLSLLGLAIAGRRRRRS
ncbi:MAG: lytic polysaccharide monooxygenase [Myxococcota bacterium]|nr:lytic polysaccharide monooxygenase [Myxococcota bacterium]